MANTITISIPTPCQENWAAMTPVDKGRFCAACQKQVTDFSQFTDRQIATALKSGAACGRFRATQLNRDLVVPKEKNNLWMAAGVAALTILPLGHELSAQVKPGTQNITKAANSTFTVKGTVSEGEILIPEVIITNNNNHETTTSDINGTYSISASKGDLLTFSSPGYEDFEITVTTDTYNATLEPMFLGEVVVVQRTFFGRVFHSIGNLFR